MTTTSRAVCDNRISMFCFTWGHYSIKWLYGETLDEVAERAAAWADGIVEKAKADAKQAALTNGMRSEEGK